MSPEAKKRLKWIEVDEATGHAGRTCLRCGISHPTLRKWLKHYQTQGLFGLESLSHLLSVLPTERSLKGMSN